MKIIATAHRLKSLLIECLDTLNDFNEDDPSPEARDLAYRINVAIGHCPSKEELAKFPHPSEWVIEYDEEDKDWVINHVDGFVGAFDTEEEALAYRLEALNLCEEIGRLN